MILGDLYTAILKRVTELTEVKHFDYYAGQFEGDEDIDNAFNFPAVFLTFRPFTPEALGALRQQADVEIELLIASQVIQEISKRESDAIRNLGLAHMALLDSIHAKLQGWNGNSVSPAINVGSLNRIAFSPLDGFAGAERGYVILHGMVYKTRITLDSAVPVTTPVEDVTLQVNQNMLPD